jgi:hypothetical protein
MAAKTPAKNKHVGDHTHPRAWDASRLRRAPDEKTAIKEAIKRFEIKRLKQQNRLITQRLN